MVWGWKFSIEQESALGTIIPKINAFFFNVNFASHPSIHIVKKIIIFASAIIIANGTGEDRQCILNN